MSREEAGMRKKSHISLAWYLMNCEGMEALGHHKYSFYVGSILPDCVPSFLVRKHTINDSFDVLKKEFEKLVSHFDPNKGADRYFCRHLGVITHYISDYFLMKKTWKLVQNHIRNGLIMIKSRDV